METSCRGGTKTGTKTGKGGCDVNLVNAVGALDQGLEERENVRNPRETLGSAATSLQVLAGELKR
jgi:hypothetical protein